MVSMRYQMDVVNHLAGQLLCDCLQDLGVARPLNCSSLAGALDAFKQVRVGEPQGMLGSPGNLLGHVLLGGAAALSTKASISASVGSAGLADVLDGRMSWMGGWIWPWITLLLLSAVILVHRPQRSTPVASRLRY